MDKLEQSALMYCRFINSFENAARTEYPFRSPDVPTATSE